MKSILSAPVDRRRLRRGFLIAQRFDLDRGLLSDFFKTCHEGSDPMLTLLINGGDRDI